MKKKFFLFVFLPINAQNLNYKYTALTKQLQFKYLIIKILLLPFFSNLIQSQNITPPMDIPLLLSGNFGELRNNHFHSGIDIKTQGVTGIPVKTVKNGYIARVVVSPYGYGNAIYINHPGGFTSVYGHLERFAPGIEKIVRNTQYQNESFAVDIFFSANELPVKKGEVVAWSGNSGASGGPHLHFELRETDTGRAIDPLPYLKNQIKDALAPEIKSIMLFPQFNKGIINGSVQNQILPLSKKKSGQPYLAKTITAWGAIGVGIKAYDRMTGTSNSYGIYEIILKVDGEIIYHSVMDKFSIDEDTRYLNTYIDWNEWTENHSFYMKSFTDPGNRLGIYQSPSNGIININKEKVYFLEYILKDVYGNKATFQFNIIGKETKIPFYEKNDIFFPYNKDNKYNEKGIDLTISPKNLYTNLYLKIDTISNYTLFAPLYIIGGKTPLHSYCPLTLKITNDIYPDKSKYGIIHQWKNKKTWLGGDYRKGKITTQIRELGQFAIEIDTVPPIITPVNKLKWRKNERISFKISDDLSGIASYKGFIDGQFVLFEYDAKNHSLYYVFDYKRMKTQGRILELTVTDGAGNRSQAVFYLDN
jgi:hypothetical protein